MAFQQQGGMGHAGPGAVPGEHGPQATEYTLQGVMRFLQIEWHSHERARNAWDIERAEMKAKIAKQEGENKQVKKLNEQLARQLRMLENSLKLERARSKGANGTASTEAAKANEAESQKDTKSKPKASGEPAISAKDHKRKFTIRADVLQTANVTLTAGAATFVPHNSFLDTTEQQETSEKEREQYLDNTSKYLKNCMKEIQYLLTPPQHPPPPQILPNGNLTGLPEAPIPMEQAYPPQRQMHGRQQHGQVMQQQQPGPPNYPPPVPGTALPQPVSRQDDVPRTMGYPEYSNSAQGSSEMTQPPTQHIPAPYEDQVESVTHTYDARGQPVLEQESQQHYQRPIRQQQADTDGWTFDEEPPINPEDPSVENPPPRRPDTDLFPAAGSASQLPGKSPPRGGSHAHGRRTSGESMNRRRSSQGKSQALDNAGASVSDDPSQFKLKFSLRGHLDVVRSVIFSGGGSPSEPEVCTAGDDGTIKRWIVPATYQNFNSGNSNPDLDINAYFTHRGHEGLITSLAAPPASTGFSTGGRANGDGWIFSGGQDCTVRLWERGRVDPKATLEGHTDAVWAVCVLPAPVGTVFGPQSSNFGGPDRLLLVSGSADRTVKVWAVSAPPQTSSPATGSRRGVGGSRRHSVTSGSNYPTSPQPSVASNTPFSYALIHSIERAGESEARPTSICSLSSSGETFVVSYTDSSVLIFDTRTGEEIVGMASTETYDGTMNTSINTVVATSLGLETAGAGVMDAARGLDSDDVGGGATGSKEGVEGVVITGHEDRFVRFFDANSGQCTYAMLGHPSAIAALALSKDGREALSAGHDASIRFWSLEKRQCTQELASHRPMRGEGVCDVCWSQDGRLVVSAGGDGVVKVFAR